MLTVFPTGDAAAGPLLHIWRDILSLLSTYLEELMGL